MRREPASAGPWRAERGTLSSFLTSIVLQNIKKIEGGPFGDIENLSKKVSQCQKKLKGGSFSQCFQLIGSKFQTPTSTDR